MDRPRVFDMVRFSLIGLLLMSIGCATASAGTKTDSGKDAAVMSQAELQAQVMAFADRYLSITVSAYEAFAAQEPPAESQKELLGTLDGMGLKSMLPQLIAAVEQVQEKGQAWVLFAFFLGIALILVFLVGAVAAALVYRHFSIRMFGSAAQPMRT